MQNLSKNDLKLTSLYDLRITYERQEEQRRGPTPGHLALGVVPRVRGRGRQSGGGQDVG